MLKALLVDDEPFIIQGLKVLIDWESQGFEISATANNGQEAYDYLLQNKVDLVICDIQMPKMTGLDLIAAVKKNNVSNAHFIILTGYADFNYAQKAIRLECSDYILKPVDSNELIKVLEKVKIEKQNSNKETNTEWSLDNTMFSNRTIDWLDSDILNQNKTILLKKDLDKLISDINTDNHVNIRNDVNQLFISFKEKDINTKSFNLNINYIIFCLLQLAYEQNAELDQEAALQFISESCLEKGIRQGSASYIYKFACEYADYLMELHRQVPSNVLHVIAQEINENYNTNITLKSLSEKYCLNSAYLGQLFKKQFGVYFKDYLNNIRLTKAEELLIKTDKKVYEIASEVGYKDLDYFVDLFIKTKGCTPARFRKQKLEG